jgi:predicted nucleic acid-binding protein
MSSPFIDTDVLIRLLTGDDPHKQAQAAALFQQVEAGQLVLEAPDTVIADAVYVLASKALYAKARAEIQELLTPLVRLPGFRVRNKRVILRALEVYGTTNRGFGDAMIIAAMEQRGTADFYSYYQGFEGCPGITRCEPCGEVVC